jgi:hypothetical protein
MLGLLAKEAHKTVGETGKAYEEEINTNEARGERERSKNKSKEEQERKKQEPRI